MKLEVVKAFGLCTVQDLGRRGHMHEAVPPGGALVPELLVAANRAAHNPDGAAAIEVLGRLVVRASEAVHIATDRVAAHVGAGEEVVVESEPRRVAYLAVRGGFEVPRVLDGHGTLLCAGLGRPLRSGDALVVDSAAGDTLVVGASSSRSDISPLDDPAVIDVLPGPDLDAFAPDALEILQSTCRIDPTSNRVGTRLVGTALPRIAAYRERSRPMVIGAIEVPRDGMPIVLGPEHPTTGGYPVIGVIATAHLGRFFAVRLGGNVRFRVSTSP